MCMYCELDKMSKENKDEMVNEIEELADDLLAQYGDGGRIARQLLLVVCMVLTIGGQTASTFGLMTAKFYEEFIKPFEEGADEEGDD